MSALPGRLLVVTDRKGGARPVAETVAAALRGGATWFWLRDRDLPAPEREELARDLKRLLAGRAALTIGGDPHLALRIGAEGAQVPAQADLRAVRRTLGPDRLMGVSAHGLADVRRAVEAGADYVTLSPIFPTPSKPGYGPPLGPIALGGAAALGARPLALGGISAENAPACLAQGAAGIAVMGGIFAASDPEAATRAFCAALSSGQDCRGRTDQLQGDQAQGPHQMHP